MNDAQRQQLLRQFRALRTQLDQFETSVTRFERELTANNILDNQKVTSTAVKKTAAAVVVAPKKDIKVSGSVKRDPMYDLEIEFSDLGDGYANPLVNPVANEEYYVRCRIRQHQAEPLLQGFQLSWSKPTGWAWIDGLGSTTYEEAVSNPAVATRVARSPSSARGGKFRVVVVERYLG